MHAQQGVQREEAINDTCVSDKKQHLSLLKKCVFFYKVTRLNEVIPKTFFQRKGLHTADQNYQKILKYLKDRCVSDQTDWGINTALSYTKSLRLLQNRLGKNHKKWNEWLPRKKTDCLKLSPPCFALQNETTSTFRF